MPDYGSPLLFGTFITPSNRQPEVPVALATLSERVGLDLVTFQDHPYQPGFLDTWTLMSWVAAQTERIHIAPNVLNVPLRPPAVTARAAASLDLLSGGRFDLALGAGAFWDAIVAMGGERLTPGQGVDALSEAIEVIRGIWNTNERAPLRLEGTHHSLHGAKRGPSPAHDLPIWIGALKPRMLRLTGRKGDGWLPSLAYLQPGDLERGNATIDEAALAAGRDPREITRLVNISGAFARSDGGMLVGPPAQWVEQLLPLALENGVSTFILASDEPDAISRFAEDVAPALREAVARERGAAGVPVGPVVRASVIALRRAGIDYAGIPAGLRATAVEPGDNAYAKVRSTYMRGGSPGLVLRPADTGEVVLALAFAREQPVALAVRSGGTASAGAPRTTAGSSSTSGRSTRSRCSTRAPGASACNRAHSGWTSQPPCSPTAGVSARATTAVWGSAGWRRPAASAGWRVSTASPSTTLSRWRWCSPTAKWCVPASRRTPICSGRCAAPAPTSA